MSRGSFHCAPQVCKECGDVVERLMLTSTKWGRDTEDLEPRVRECVRDFLRATRQRQATATAAKERIEAAKLAAAKRAANAAKGAKRGR